MRDFNGNSTDQNKKEPETTRAKPIKMQGSVGSKKTNLFTNLVDKLIISDGKSVRYNVTNDVIIPGVKDLLSKACKTALDMILFGGTRIDRDNNYTRIRDYSRRDSSLSSSSDRTNEIIKNRNISGYRKACDTSFDFKPDAEDALEAMKNLLRDYGYATIADFLTTVDRGNDISFTDNDYGWKGINALDEASIIRGNGDKYYILFPKAIVLK